MGTAQSQRGHHALHGLRGTWWISGAYALELYLNRSWRSHDDLDVGVLRQHIPALARVLRGWDTEVAASGVLSEWDGSVPLVQEGQNNLWCRRGTEQPWCLDVTVGDGDQQCWVFQRDPTVRVPWKEAVLRTERGVPYLAPELQLLHKSNDFRPKDDHDAAEVVPPWRRTAGTGSTICCEMTIPGRPF
jgi:hypothetical protein